MLFRSLPRSIAWDRMDDIEFAELNAKVDDFMRTDHAQAFLWPHLDPARRAELVESLEREFA